MARSTPSSPKRPPAGTAITLVRRHPLLAGATILGLSVLLAWSVATTSYILFHDDALRALAYRARSQSAGYEAQIAEMQSVIEAERSRALVARARTEAAVDLLRQRQSAIEQRQGQIDALVRDLPSGGGASAAPVSRAASGGSADTGAAPSLRGTRPDASFRPARTMEAEIVSLAGDFDRSEQRQAETLAALENDMAARVRHVHSVMADLGLAPRAARRTAADAGAMGGPYVPVEGAPVDGTDRVRALVADLAAMTERLDRVPVRPPLAGALETSSGFGVRIDPLLGRPAFHTGIDFRGEPGDRARAAASGVVVNAGRDGSYGLMVEIDHGNGLATRYAHLASIAVEAGDKVDAGAILGRVGSTGRSTGLHLHYEVRVRGDAVDPQRFLRAGLRLGDVG